MMNKKNGANDNIITKKGVISASVAYLLLNALILGLLFYGYFRFSEIYTDYEDDAVKKRIFDGIYYSVPMLLNIFMETSMVLYTFELY